MSQAAVDALLPTLAADTGATMATIRPNSLSPGARNPDDVASPAQLTVRRELGRGGMGIVELAEQSALRRDVAVKRLAAPGERSAQLLIQEATLTGQLEHPNIVPIHMLLKSDTGPAVVMKRISGRSWLDALNAGDHNLETSLSVFIKVCDAVAFAHSREVVHRDIKPENVMLGDFGEVYLVDWGLARRASDGPPSGIAGTPAYMPPEFLEARADVRSDVFLLGATLHHALCGSPRHGAEEMREVFRQIRSCAPHRYTEEIPVELGAICNRACALNPDDRHASVDELRDAIQTYLEHRSANALSAAAQAKVQELQPHWSRASSDEYSTAQSLFVEARFGFDQALAAWPQSPGARRGLAELLAGMVEFELALEHPDQAAVLLDAMPQEDASLRERIEEMRMIHLSKAARLRELERDRDHAVGAASRKTAQLVWGAAIVLLTAALLGVRFAFPHMATAALRLTIAGLIVFGVTGGIVAWWRRRGRWNLVNRRIAQIALATLGVSLCNRFAGLAADAPASQILIVDAFLLALGGVALTPFQRSGPVVAALALGVGFVGAVWPAWIQPLFVSLAILIPLGALVYVAYRRLV